jgi:uncharacterized protein (DUF1015 family)
MAAIRPFRALRPTPEAAPRVAAVPYDVVTTAEARALASANPLSFLHVSRAEIDLPPDTDPYSEDVYVKAVENLHGLRREAPLVVEKEPSLYLYRLRMGRHEQTGLAATYSLGEYERDIIKKHERTRPEKEDDRTRHMIALHAQSGPVFLTYQSSSEVDSIVSQVCDADPLFDFTAEDGVAHTVWRVSGAEAGLLAHAFDRIPVLYIADGHHRAASAARTRRHLRSSAFGLAAEVRTVGSAAYDWFLAVAFPHDQVQILPYNRIVRDLNGRSPDEFLDRVNARVEVAPGSPVPGRRGQVAMYLAGRWYCLTFGPEVRHAATSAAPTAGLDASLLQDHVLEPVLGIADPRTDRRIDFVGGIRGTSELRRRVDAGEAAVAFSLCAVAVEDLMAVADAGGTMPPKSTWFEPKLRDGLLIHQIQ